MYELHLKKILKYISLKNSKGKEDWLYNVQL